LEILERLWAESDAWPEYIQAMRLPFADLMKNQEGEDRYPHLSRWADLPQLCCSAAGGGVDRAEYLSLAWKLFYFAADIMDTIQDGDPADDCRGDQRGDRTVFQRQFGSKPHANA
jgi:hypothetical protein